VTIAYLVNQYPQSSQSFIRREIAAIEQLGARVERFTVRSWPTPLVDERDREEQRRTRVLLNVGYPGLALATLRTLLSRPAAFYRALALALGIGWRSDRGVFYHLIYLAEACVLLKWLADCGAAHVHAHFGTNSTAVAMLCRALGGPPYSFTAHGPEEFDGPRSLRLEEKIRHAAFVVAISQFGRSQLYRWCAHDQWPKIHVVRCGVDDLFLSVRRTPPLDVPRLVCVGRLTEQKGQLLLVEAAARLAADGILFELVLVGDGPMRKDVEACIKRHHLCDRVRITGWMSNEQVREQIQQSRAMVLPSFAEGLPVVIMESLALGRPVISTTVAGIPELVRDGTSGWLVPPGAVGPLADAMREALRASPQELQRMGEAGAALVAERHNAATEAGKLATLFEKSQANGR